MRDLSIVKSKLHFIPLETPTESGKAKVGIEELGGILRRQLLMIILLGVIGFVGAYMFTNTLPNLYEARTKILLQPQNTRLLETLPDEVETSFNDEDIVTELEIINSRFLAERVVDNLNLTADPAYNTYLASPAEDPAGEPAGSWTDSLFGWLGSEPDPEVETTGEAAEETDGGAAKGTRINSDETEQPVAPPSMEEQRQAATTKLMSAVSIGRHGRSLAITIIVTDTDPERAAAIANSIAVEYLELSVEQPRESTEKAIAFLTQRSDQLGLEVAKLEREIANHQIQFRLSDPQYAGFLRAEIEQLKVQLQIAQNAGGASEASNTAAIEEELRNKNAELDERTRAEIELRQMERHARSGQERYEEMIRRLGNLDLQAEILTPQGRILSFAQVPTQASSPKRLLLSLVGLAAGLLVAIFLVVIREGTDKKVRNEKQVETLTNIPILSMLPEVKKEKWGGQIKPHQYIAKKPLSHYADAVRQLITGCQFILPPGVETPTIMVTSAIQDEGKTTTTISIAVAAAHEGRRVILIDADYHKCGSSLAIGIPDYVNSLEEVLNGTCELEDAIYTHPDHENFDILGFPDFPSNVEGMLNQQAMKQLLARLKKEYGMIIVDTPPTLMASNTTFMANLADLIVVVVRWAKTDTEMLSRVLKKIRVFSNVPAGIALSRVDFNRLAKQRYDANAKYHAYSDNDYYRN